MKSVKADESPQKVLTEDAEKNHGSSAGTGAGKRAKVFIVPYLIQACYFLSGI
jgi:hypothetical protein